MDELEAILRPYQGEVEHASFLGVPLTQLSTRQLQAALVMMSILYETVKHPQQIGLSRNSGHPLSIGK